MRWTSKESTNGGICLREHHNCSSCERGLNHLDQSPRLSGDWLSVIRSVFRQHTHSGCWIRVQTFFSSARYPLYGELAVSGLLNDEWHHTSTRL